MSTPDPSSPPLPSYEDLCGTVAAMARTLEQVVARQQGEAPQPWLTGDDPDTARDLFAELVGWLHAVWCRYPDSHLQDCWYRHPWAIEELNACRLAWVGAYKRGAPAGLASEWHRTVRPGTQQRLKQGLQSCELTEHPSPPSTLHEPNDPDDVVLPWITNRDEPSLHHL